MDLLLHSKNHRRLILGFGIVLAGLLLAGIRIARLEALDHVSSVPLGYAEATRDGDGFLLDLGSFSYEDADLMIRVCVPDHTGEWPTDVAVQLLPEAGAQPTWSLAAEGAEAATTDCLLLHKRGVLEGSLALFWPAGALGGYPADGLPLGRLLPLGSRTAGAVHAQNADLALPLGAEVVVVARAPFGPWERALFLVLFLGGICVLSAGQMTKRVPADWRISQALSVMGIFLLASVVASGFGTAQSALFAGMVLSIGIYVGATLHAGWVANPGGPLAALAFCRISRGTAVWAGALGVAMAVTAALMLSTLPQGDSPMTLMLQTSAGLGTAVALALVAPWAEELLLRGAVFGSVEHRFGGVAAVIASAGVFSLLHLAQHWGNFAPWIVLNATGLLLSLVRWKTGSSLASAVTHFSYNITLAIGAVVVG